MGRNLVISALAGVVLLGASCIGGGMGVPIVPAGITGDGSCGAIVIYAVYETLTKQDYYVQKISPAGDFLWGERGVLLGSTGNGIPYSEAVTDGSGGTIVMWSECHPKVRGEPRCCQTYAARIDSEGDIRWKWGREGVDIQSMIADSAGGVIIGVLVGDTRGYLLKIDSEGNLPWGEIGVAVESVPAWPTHSREIASDGSGGAIIIQYGSDCFNCVQRVDSQGNMLWQAGGVQIPGGSACIASDGSGGCVIAYTRDNPDGEVGYIYAQRIDAEGNVLWGRDGVLVFSATKPSIVHDPQIVADGAGGAIVFFVAEGGVRAQRIDADGRKAWNKDVPVCPCVNLHTASDSSGGAFCIWWDGMAQRLDATGTKLWGPEGVTFTTQDIRASGLALVSDGCRGLLISWHGDIRWRGHNIANVPYYAQRVNAEGNVVWGNKGILLNP